MNKHLTRNKDKYNPYTLEVDEENNIYIVIFKDSRNVLYISLFSDFIAILLAVYLCRIMWTSKYILSNYVKRYFSKSFSIQEA